MVIMPLRAFLAILLVFCFFILLINCFIENKKSDFINNVYVINEKDIMLNEIPIDNLTKCLGLLFCYPSQLSLHSKGIWKPTKTFEISKKDGNKLCNESQQKWPNDLRKIENFEWHAKILKSSKVDKEFLNATSNPRPLFDDYAGLLALKLDIMLGINENIPTKPDNRMFFWKFDNKCQENDERKAKQDPHTLQFLANVYELGCFPTDDENLQIKDSDKRCKIISKNYNKECEE
uniref:Uncharacterized protein n=1 Tax=Meloidogyne hapla TaxID=6305 RepID=A0A1I8BTH0_MELHA